MQQTYDYMLSSRFKADCDNARRNSSIRSRIDQLHHELSAPFQNGKKAEKLVGSAYQNRYSLRVNDNYRVIFDLVGNTLVYRALSSHEESYRRAKVLPPPNLAKVARFADIYKPSAKYQPSVNRSLPAANSPAELIGDNSADAVEGNPLMLAMEDVPGSDLGFDSHEESFVLLGGASEITAALASDIAEWMLFLPEDHRRFITQRFNGPTRVFGPSGTGKTCILLHRAVHLAQASQSPALIVTFRPTLAKVITRLKERLCSKNPGTNELVTVSSLDGLARQIAGIDEMMSITQHEHLIRSSRRNIPQPPATLMRKLRKNQDIDSYASNEVLNWIKGTAYGSQEIYQALDFPRGKGQLSALERDWFYSLFEAYETAKGESFDEQDLLIRAEANLAATSTQSEWKSILVDEFQDLNLCGLSLLKTLAEKHAASLFFTGDHRQRIYRTLPSFRDAGIHIVGRSFGLAANYRNTPEIYTAAKSLYGSQGEDPDSEGLEDEEIKLLRASSRKPVIRGFIDSTLENEWICAEISRLIASGVSPGDIALVSLSIDQSDQVNWEARFPIISLDNSRVERLAYFHDKSVKRSTIHEVKGLEFPIVFLMGLSAEAFALDAILRSEDDADSVIGSLLYVAMTRARDRLYLSFSGSPVPLLRAAKIAHFEMDEITVAILNEVG